MKGFYRSRHITDGVSAVGYMLINMNEIKLYGKWKILNTGEEFDGELVILDNNKLFLHLTALFDENVDNPLKRFKASGNQPLIIGNIYNGGKITLFDNYFLGEHIELGSRNSINVISKYGFWNLEANNIDDLLFNNVEVDFGQIIKWSRMCYYKWENDFEFNNQNLKWVQKIEDKEIVVNENFILKIYSDSGTHSSYITDKEVKINQNIIFSFRYKSAVKWCEILNDINKIKAIISFGMLQPVYIKSIRYLNNQNRHMNDIFLGNDDFGITKDIDSSIYLFDLLDLINDNNAVFTKIFNEGDKLLSIISLCQIAYSGTNVPNYVVFINLVQAIETFHSRYVSDNYNEYCKFILENYSESYNYLINNNYKKITLKDRLRYMLYNINKEIFDILNIKKDKFIDDVKVSRDYYTHYDINKKDKAFSKDELNIVNMILLTFINFFILTQINLDKKKINERIIHLFTNISYNIKK